MGTVLSENEVLLNGVFFPLTSKVIKTQYQTGMSELQHFFIIDQSGGIGCLDLKRNRNRNRNQNKSWFSTCYTDEPGHIIPPTLAVADTAFIYSTVIPFTYLTDLTNAAWTDASTIVVGADHITATNKSGSVLQAANVAAAYKSKTVKIIVNAAIIYTGAGAATAAITLTDGTNTTTAVLPTTTTAAADYVLTHTFAAGATALTLTFAITYASGAVSYEIDDIVIRIPSVTTPLMMCDSPTALYYAVDKTVYTMNSSGVWSVYYVYPATITWIGMFGTSLVIGQGASVWWYNTTITDAANLYKGIEAHAKLYYISSGGALASVATLAASPSVTADATITEGSTIWALELYQDAAGSPCIYCRTNKSLWVHDKDSTPTRWLRANVSLAPLSTTGKGGVVSDGLYISQGIHLVKYVAGGYNATVYNGIGLDASGGVPSEYNAHIVGMFKGTNHIYALMDSTQIGTTGYSWIAKYNEEKQSWGVEWDVSALDTWVSPTSSDDGGLWTTEANAYDNNVATYAQINITTGTWSGYLQLNIASANTNAIKFQVATTTPYVPIVDIDLYYGGAWHDLYSELTPINQWVIVPFTNQAVTAARIRGYNSATATRTFGVADLYFRTETINKVMYCGIVSSVYAQRLWFNCGGTLYYIPLPSTLLFPKLVSTSTYAANAFHISPWLEGDTSTYAKLATAIVSFCKDITTTETVTVKYRTNRSSNSAFDGWTTLVILDTTAEANRVETAIASGAGIAGNAFQIKLNLDRGSTTTTAPDVQGLDLTYFDKVTVKYAFALAISTASPYKGNSSKQLEAALKTALESTTLLSFTYRDGTDTADTYYVKMQPDKAQQVTGREYAGKHEIVLIQP